MTRIFLLMLIVQLFFTFTVSAVVKGDTVHMAQMEKKITAISRPIISWMIPSSY
jgi:hypothetical protein